MPYRSIRGLLDGPEDDPRRTMVADTLLSRRREQLGELIYPSAEAVNPATADSIFRVLGEPRHPIKVSKQPLREGLALFDEVTGQITFDPVYTAFTTARDRNPANTAHLGIEHFPPVDETLAHEMAHQATVRADREIVSDNPEVQGFLNLFLDRYDSLSPEEQYRLLAEYKGEHPERKNIFGEILAPDSSGYKPKGTDRIEVVADALARGFKIARSSDPDDPSVGREERRDLDTQFPGTREAFNFWMRSFLQLPRDGS